MGNWGCTHEGASEKTRGARWRALCLLFSWRIDRADRCGAAAVTHLCRHRFLQLTHTRTHPPKFVRPSVRRVRVDGPTGWSARAPLRLPATPCTRFIGHSSFWSECVRASSRPSRKKVTSKLHRFRGVAKSPAAEKIRPKKHGIFHSLGELGILSLSPDVIWIEKGCKLNVAPSNW